MGLFDGRDGTSDQGSTAQVAKWLGAPVLLVLDCSAIARSAAAVVKGYQDFDPGLRLGGLLFNKVGGKAHTQWLKDAIAAAGLSVEVLGGIPQVSPCLSCRLCWPALMCFVQPLLECSMHWNGPLRALRRGGAACCE